MNLRECQRAILTLKAYHIARLLESDYGRSMTLQKGNTLAGGQSIEKLEDAPQSNWTDIYPMSALSQ
jgi:hypothetical protein